MPVERQPRKRRLGKKTENSLELARDRGRGYQKGLLRDVATWYSDRETLRVLTKLLPKGEVLRDLLLALAIDERARRWIESPETFRAATDELDRKLLILVRNLAPETPRAETDELHALFVEKFLTERGLSVEKITAFFRDRRRLSGLLEQFEPDLEVEVQGQCDAVEFSTKDGLLASIAEPQLLWECCCHQVGHPAGGPYPRAPDCRLHIDDTLPETLDRLFSEGTVQISYGGVSTYWFESPDFWPPSIDSFRMIEGIKMDGGFVGPIKDVLDIGCGTGFLGICAVMELQRRVRVTFSDWMATPLFWTAVNWHLNGCGQNGSILDLRLALGTTWQKKTSGTKSFDLVLCNPPYLPIPPHLPRLKLTSTVAGTDLLEEIIERAGELSKTGRVYIGFSDLAREEVEAVCERCGLPFPQLVGAKDRVPFRVPSALENTEYIDWLVKERGLEQRTGKGMSLWHEVGTYRVLK